MREAAVGADTCVPRGLSLGTFCTILEDTGGPF